MKKPADIADKIAEQTRALWANLPEGEGPSDDDVLDAGLADDGTVARVGDRDTGDLYMPGLAGETIRLRPLETGLLEMTTWQAGKMVRLDHLRRKAGTGAQPND